MNEPRIVPPEEARFWLDQASPAPWTWVNLEAGDHPDVQLMAVAPDLAHTVAVLGEQRAAVLALDLDRIACEVCEAIGSDNGLGTVYAALCEVRNAGATS